MEGPGSSGGGEQQRMSWWDTTEGRISTLLDSQPQPTRRRPRWLAGSRPATFNHTSGQIIEIRHNPDSGGNTVVSRKHLDGSQELITIGLDVRVGSDGDPLLAHHAIGGADSVIEELDSHDQGAVRDRLDLILAMAGDCVEPE